MFETHKLNEQGFTQVEAFKKAITKMWLEIDGILPESREKSIFKTKLEEAAFFGTKAVASKEGNFTEIVSYVR